MVLRSSLISCAGALVVSALAAGCGGQNDADGGETPGSSGGSAGTRSTGSGSGTTGGSGDAGGAPGTGTDDGADGDDDATDDSGATEEPDENDDEVEVGEGPSLVGTLPENGAVGVREDAAFVFQFDRRMDPETTLAAYVSLELPPESVKFLWNDNGDTLTVSPKDPLAYATGDATVGAFGYNVRITTDATDTDGNPLEEDALISVTTLRRIEFAPARIQELTGTVHSSGSSDTNPIWVGDLWNGEEYRGFTSFSLDSLPDDYVEIESAYLVVEETWSNGEPDEVLGELQAYHVLYEDMDLSAFVAEPLHGETFDFMKGDPLTRWVEVTDFVVDDAANRVAREDRTQVRLQYPAGPDNDVTDIVQFDPIATLEIVYLDE